MWLPDVEVRTAGDRLVVHVPHVGDVSIATPANAFLAAPARYGFILHEERCEWSLILGTGASPDAALRNALDELTRIWVEELGERAAERHCATRAAIYPELRQTALMCLRLTSTELPT